MTDLTDRHAAPWRQFRKPAEEDLRRSLDVDQYRVTQEEGTEAPFRNA